MSRTRTEADVQRLDNRLGGASLNDDSLSDASPNGSALQTARYWAPALTAAALAWLLLLFVGQTPIVRATGLALVILGITAAMRHMGFIASIGGGLTLALCPIFWSQAGGGISGPATIVVAIGIALAVLLFSWLLLKRSDLGIGLGIVAFLAIFWSQIGTAQSLRLTGFVTAWLLYLMVDMLLLTNPRPGIKPLRAPKPHHTAGILFLFLIGTINDPLLTFFAPAILLSLLLSYAALPKWYWAAVTITALAGAVMLVQSYLLPQPPPVNLWGWREAVRWIELAELLVGQFGIWGILLGLVGLARLARWYPPLGTVTMIAYSAYTFLGLVFVGNFREVLLLPLVIIQVMWMTYAVSALGQWLNKTLPNERALWLHVSAAFYLLLPAILLWHIVQPNVQ